jgi:hypothetical protein
MAEEHGHMPAGRCFKLVRASPTGDGRGAAGRHDSGGCTSGHERDRAGPASVWGGRAGAARARYPP